MNDDFEELKRKLHADMAAAAERQWQESFRQAGGYGGLGAMGGSRDYPDYAGLNRMEARSAGQTLARRIIKVCRQTAITPRVRAQLKAEAVKIVAEKTGQDPVLLGAMADGVRDYLNNHNIPVRF